MKEREFWIDAVRSFACICVVATHAPIPSTESGRIFVPFFNFLAVGGASILFFMISGALIFYRQQEFVPFMKKRISRVVFPMVFWTIVIKILECVSGRDDWSQFGQKIMMIPFYPQVGTFWFIYVIFGIYLLTPMISTWLAHTTRREVEWVLGIWGFTLTLRYFGGDKSSHIVDFHDGYLYYFFGYMGFALLGYYLRKYFLRDTPLNWRYFLVPMIVVAVSFSVYPFVEHSMMQNHGTLHMAILAASYFLIIKKLPLSTLMRNIVYTFAQYSFGIYLVHNHIIKLYVVWPLLRGCGWGHLVEIPLITAMTVSLSFLLVWLISKIVPGSKYIVGV